MDENKKRERPGGTATVAAESNKRGRTPPTDDDEDDDDGVAALLSVDEDAFADLWKLLEGETPSPEKVRFVNFPTPEIFQPSDAYVTINGNDESCGSSFSERDSSVMASFDLAGIAVLHGGAWGPEARGGAVEGRGTDGWDCPDEFDGMLARFLCEDLSKQN